MNLDQRVGPFSTGAWLAIAAGGIGGGILLRRTGLFAGFQQAPAAPLPSDDDAGVPLIPAVQSGGTVGLPQGSAPSVPTGPITNEQWLQRAVPYLAGMSPPVDALQADTALRKYLANLGLTSSQQKIVSIAVRVFGTPPEGTGPAITIPDPPVSKPKPTLPPEWNGPGRPAGNIRITADGRVHAAALAQFFYGKGNQNWWIKIRDANRGVVKEPYQIIPKGTTIIVP